MKLPDELTHRPADRILKIVTELQEELTHAEAEFQLRLQEVVQETEARIRASVSEQHERAIKEAEDTARREAQQKLLAQFEVEIAKLSSDSDRHIREAVAKADAEAQAKLRQGVADAQQTTRNEVTQELKSQYEAKLAELSKAKEEVDRKLQQATKEWNAEREQLQSSAKAAAEAVPQGSQHPEVASAVRDEIARMQAAIQEITNKLDDPKVELAAEIRLNRERAELDAYLKGLQYSVGEVSV